MSDQTHEEWTRATNERLGRAGWQVINEEADGVLSSRWVNAAGRDDSAEFIGLVHGDLARCEYQRHQDLAGLARRGADEIPAARRWGRSRVSALLMVAVGLLLLAQLVRLASYVWGLT